MNRRFVRFASIGLIASFLVLNGWLQLQATHHALKHAHHTAAGHADPLCTWVCSAAQVILDSDVILPGQIQPIAPAEISLVSIVPVQSASFIQSRGPPESAL